MNIEERIELEKDCGLLLEVRPFQLNLFSPHEMIKYSGWKEYAQGAYAEFGVFPKWFIWDFYGVTPTPEYYYRR